MSATIDDIIGTTRVMYLGDTPGDYEIWEKRMKARLVQKKGWGVVYWKGQDKEWETEEKKQKEYERWEAARDEGTMEEALAEIIGRLSDSQLSHVESDDPMEVWEALARIHQARGLGTALALKRQLSRMTKTDIETMSAWVGRVKAAAYRLKLRGITVSDLDVIVTLTEGLGKNYEPLIISLDSMPEDQLTLVRVVERVLNEEMRQGGVKQGAAAEIRSAMEAMSGGQTALVSKEFESGPKKCWKCGLVGHRAAWCKTPTTDGSDPDHRANLASDSRVHVAYAAGSREYEQLMDLGSVTVGRTL